jgi:hypothetical protein
MPEPETIGPEGSEQTPPTGETPSNEQTTSEGPGESSFHYKTHEAAEEAARRFQGEKDRLTADLDRVLTLPNGERATVSDLIRFRDAMIPVTEREDFAPFLRGDLSPAAQAAAPEDEYLSDEEKSRRAELGTMKEELTQSQRTIAEFYFDQTMERVLKDWGGLLDKQRDTAGTTFSKLLGLSGIKDPKRQITEEYVEQVLLQSVPREDRDALWERRIQSRAESRATEQGQRATTVPGTESAPTDAEDNLKWLRRFQTHQVRSHVVP